MKTMIVSDVMTGAKYLVPLAIEALIIGFVIAWGMREGLAVVSIIVIMSAFAMCFTLFALDEQNGWQSFRCTLPLSRAQIVRGRYASVFVCTCLGLVVAMAAYALWCASTWVVPADILGGYAEQLRVVPEAADFVGIVLISFAVSLLFVAVVAPVLLKMGLTNSVKVFGYIVVAVLIIVFALMYAGSDIVQPLLDFIADTPTLTLGAGAFVVAVVLYVVSSQFAIKLYETREF